jgi:hypothetical protein
MASSPFGTAFQRTGPAATQYSRVAADAGTGALSAATVSSGRAATGL